MADSQVLEKVGALAAEVKSIKDGQKTQAETKERLEKLEPLVAEIQKFMTEDVRRKTAHVGEGDTASAAARFVRKGFRTIDSLVDVPVYQETWDGRATTERVVSVDEKAALDLHDDFLTVYQMLRFQKGEVAWDTRVMREGVEKVCAENMPRTWKRWKAFVDELRQKATMDTATAGEGLEWVPTGYSSQLYDQIRLECPEVNAFTRFQQPTASFVLPLITTMPTAYIKSEGVAPTQSEPVTSNKTWTAKAVATYSKWTDEITEDSIIAILPVIRSSMVRSLAEGYSLGLMNGDTSGTHMDNDTAGGAASLVQKGFNGIRYNSNVASNGKKYDTTGASGSSLTSAHILGGLKLMGKFAARRPEELIFCCDTAAFIDLLGDSYVRTVDLYGPQAPVITGELARIWGMPIMISFAIENRRNAVAATGVNTSGGPNTFSTAVAFNRRNWLLGERRQVTFEQDKVISTGINEMIVTTRISFKNIEDNTANDGPSVVYHSFG